MRELEALRDFFASATLTAVVDLPFILLTLRSSRSSAARWCWCRLLMVPLVILVGWLTQPAMDRLSARAMGEGMVKQSVLVETIGGLETVKAARRRAAARRAGRRRSSSIQRQLASPAADRERSDHHRDLGRHDLLCRRRHRRRRDDRQAGADHGRPDRLLDPRRPGDRAARPDLAIAVADDLDPDRLSPAQRADEPAARRAAGRGLEAARLKGRIEFRNVSFRYPGAPEKGARRDELHDRAGRACRLLGRVGSGKSTIARLVLGLYPPEEGLVMIDGTDIRQLDPANLRANIGAALQESVLLTGSVRENIVLGRAGSTTRR
jgi:ATP-binding cassette subfamily C protein LapB